MNMLLSKGLRLLLICSITSIGLTACGGGDENSNTSSANPTDPSTVFQLFVANAFTEGFQETYNLSGSDTEGNSYTATLSTRVEAETTFLGVPAIPVLGQVQINNTTSGGVVSNIATIYYSTSPDSRQYLGYAGDTQTVTAETTIIPKTGRIGDFGIIGTYTDNTGSVDTQSWRIDDGFNGNANIVILSSTVDQYGDPESSSNETYLIDEDGNRISVKVVIYYPNAGVTITLTGS